MKIDILKEIEFGEGVTAELDKAFLKVKGPKGEVSREFFHPKISISIDNGKVVLSANKGTKREKIMIGSFQAHIRNMVKGVTEPFVYKLKICSGHFPMNVSVSGNQVVIKNFLGEAVPRKVEFAQGVEVKINGTEIVITSSDREAAGQTAAKIESLCRVTDRDRRIFQDGCFIIEKAGKQI